MNNNKLIKDVIENGQSEDSDDIVFDFNIPESFKISKGPHSTLSSSSASEVSSDGVPPEKSEEENRKHEKEEYDKRVNRLSSFCEKDSKDFVSFMRSKTKANVKNAAYVIKYATTYELYSHWDADPETFDVNSFDVTLAALLVAANILNSPELIDSTYEYCIQKICTAENITRKELTENPEFYFSILHGAYVKIKNIKPNIGDAYMLKDYVSNLILTSSYRHVAKLINIKSVCEETIHRLDGTSSIDDFLETYTPQILKEYLDEYIIGQDDAKMSIAIAAIEHLKRIRYPEKELKKNNVLLIGPSGCGKTEILRTLRRIYPVPITFCDASGLSSDGWKGDKKVSTFVKDVVRNGADFLKTTYGIDGSEYLPRNFISDFALKGILFIDEFDKAVSPQYNSGGNNVSADIQGEMLKLFEDGSFSVEVRDGAQASVDVKNLLIICAGAFSAIKKKKEISVLGFGTESSLDEILDKNEKLEYNHDDIIEFGVTPELAGRIPVIETVYSLTKEDLVRIMKDVKNSSISSFKEEMEKAFSYHIEFSDDAYWDIANSLEKDTGARSIPSILSKLKKKIVYSAEPGSDILITKHNDFIIKDALKPQEIL